MELTTNNLIYYRCRDCLSTFTSEDSPIICACDGILERLGKVTWDKKRYEEHQRVSVCDARCTNASGPLCNCKCNCSNHGTGRTIEVITREGKVYVKTIDDAALNRAAEYRGLKQEVFEVLNTYSTLPNKNWSTYYINHGYFKKLSQLKQHKIRVIKLTELLISLTLLVEQLSKSKTEELLPF